MGMEQILIDDPEAGAVPLAVRLDRPSAPRRDDLCILYTHGFGSSQDGEKARFFRRRALADGLSFCSFDFRGHGESGGELFDLSLSRNLDDCRQVHDWLRRQGYESFVQIGSSMGGGTALWYAARFPQDIVAALHIAPALEMEDGLLRAVGKRGARRWEKAGRFTFTSELIAAELGWGLIEDLRRYQLGELQRTYRTPTLLLQGKNDSSVFWRSVVEFATGCDFEEIEVQLFCDGDHRLIDRLDDLWRRMVAFLECKKILERRAVVGTRG